MANQITRYVYMKRVKKLFFYNKTIQLPFPLLQIWSRIYSDRNANSVVI